MTGFLNAILNAEKPRDGQDGLNKENEGLNYYYRRKRCPGSVNNIPYQTKSDYCANTKIRATRNSPSLINGPTQLSGAGQSGIGSKKLVVYLIIF